MFGRLLFTLTSLSLASVLPVHAQIVSELDCRELALQAIASTEQLCDATAPGEICFGSGHVQLSLLEPARFSLPGDRASTASLQQVALSSLALDDQVWSFAVVQLPDAIDTRLVAWGDVLIENRAADSSLTNPFQDISLRTGRGITACPEMSQPGLLVEVNGAEPLEFRVNGVNLRVEETLFLQAIPGRSLVVNALDGSVRVDVDGIYALVPAGTFVQVPLRPSLSPAWIASTPVAYADTLMCALPLQLFEDYRGQYPQRQCWWQSPPMSERPVEVAGLP